MAHHTAGSHAHRVLLEGARKKEYPSAISHLGLSCESVSDIDEECSAVPSGRREVGLCLVPYSPDCMYLGRTFLYASGSPLGLPGAGVG